MKKICPKCSAEHENPGRFCSRKCANSRGPRTEDFKRKVREKLLGRPCPALRVPRGPQVPRIAKVCAECGTQFFATKANTRKYCSKSCGQKHIGGYREGSGRSKSGYYKGIYCGSTYELAWVIYQLDHNISFTRFPDPLREGNITYIPDFLQNGNIVEIKGYENYHAAVSVADKNEVARKHGYSVTVLRKEDLSKEFKWVKEHYNYKKMYELYDGYKPKYTYHCSFCGIEFTKDYAPKTERVYCSANIS